MPFYEALRYILNTATGKARRESWEPGTFITRGFKQECMGVVLAQRNEEGKIVYTAYTAKPNDLVANYWCLVVEVV